MFLQPNSRRAVGKDRESKGWQQLPIVLPESKQTRRMMQLSPVPTLV